MSSGDKPTLIFKRDGALDRAMQVWATRVWDKDDSRSVLRLAPEVIQRRMLEIPEDVRYLDEPQLRKQIRPTATDNQLRISFWLEYDRCQREMDKQMQMTAIIRGIISEDYFYNVYIKNLTRLAWILIPPKSYTVKLSEMLELGLDQLRETLELPHIESNGKVNTKLLELKLKITAMMDMRMNGAIAQKVQIEQKNMNMNLHLRNSADEISGLIESKNMEELDRKLADLRKKEAMLTQGIHPQAEKSEVVVEAVVENGELENERPDSGSS